MSIEIIGAQEYQWFMHENRQNIIEHDKNKAHIFHPYFIHLLDTNTCGEVSWVFLDDMQDFSEFSTNQGIYFCLRYSATSTKSREIWYVGMAGNFRSRWKNHHKFQPLKAIQNVAVVCLHLDNYSRQEISEAERIYIDMLNPVFNNTSKPEKHLRIAS